MKNGRGVETACGGGGGLPLPRQPARQNSLTLTGLAGEGDDEFLSTPTRAVLAPRRWGTLVLRAPEVSLGASAPALLPIRAGWGTKRVALALYSCILATPRLIRRVNRTTDK